jgi:hypothetical protein
MINLKPRRVDNYEGRRRYDSVYLCFGNDLDCLLPTNRVSKYWTNADLNATSDISGVVRLRILDEAQEWVLDVTIFKEAVPEESKVDIEPSMHPHMAQIWYIQRKARRTRIRWIHRVGYHAVMFRGSALPSLTATRRLPLIVY